MIKDIHCPKCGSSNVTLIVGTIPTELECRGVDCKNKWTEERRISGKNKTNQE